MRAALRLTWEMPCVSQHSENLRGTEQLKEEEEEEEEEELELAVGPCSVGHALSAPGRPPAERLRGRPAHERHSTGWRTGRRHAPRTPSSSAGMVVTARIWAGR